MEWRTNATRKGSATFRYLIRAVVHWDLVSQFLGNAMFVPLLNQTSKNEAGVGVVPQLSEFTHPVSNHDGKEDMIYPTVVTPAALVELDRRSQVVQVLGI